MNEFSTENWMHRQLRFLDNFFHSFLCMHICVRVFIRKKNADDLI